MRAGKIIASQGTQGGACEFEGPSGASSF
ncbi:ferredoxin, partial [Rhizobium ruizarguesonis]